MIHYIGLLINFWNIIRCCIYNYMLISRNNFSIFHDIQVFIYTLNNCNVIWLVLFADHNYKATFIELRANGELFHIMVAGRGAAKINSCRNKANYNSNSLTYKCWYWFNIFPVSVNLVYRHCVTAWIWWRRDIEDA